MLVVWQGARRCLSCNGQRTNQAHQFHQKSHHRREPISEKLDRYHLIRSSCISLHLFSCVRQDWGQSGKKSKVTERCGLAVGAETVSSAAKIRGPTSEIDHEKVRITRVRIIIRALHHPRIPRSKERSTNHRWVESSRV
ncbi:PREDICTED: uncharacterized protein LOC108749410 [Trachymyrmex septentrionalis]|uniref:uncharacterized protein LOC108749410 n=1 Tax=Trachymyrmex septentrionalis TaxID=34720 RepID=UPI00084F5DCF|nr:PREDICTED: uncharacterized protein LOC108749410 [Trachymyrmex septentrionalis]XP_018343592.1 PREDICTED: uncharacterized protein LOC108749410 [Trachymyrmex septentrionalis]XP_018343593.1 PREDICTED: uncharacterized protein LOC108749410 [Trachymyrmex septentrionalis]XP_018343594.1 PREDICTED: uncharacterized protein LOC108749410 [Trachymyrmex septentrionalis]XP_018343595.1 PREDICTED: uncharacterized protein LOC108749410 [Trachymyrmex septentrionalis]